MQSSHKNTVEITQTFIHSMFQHPLFKKKISELLKSSNSLEKDNFLLAPNAQTAQIVQQISQTLFQNLIQIQQRIRDNFQQKLLSLYQQIQKLKDFSYQNIDRMDDLPNQLGAQSIIEDDQIFDLPSMRCTISFLKEKVKQISQNSTVMLESSQIQKQYKEKNQVFSDKISAEIAKIEQKLVIQHDILQDSVNKKIEKQQKTINNILETLNELSEPYKKDKTTGTLTNCKSATKLKNFFGFS